MTHELATHPLTQKFWRTPGIQMAENHSMTEDDYNFVIVLEESGRVLLREVRYSYYDTSSRTTRTLEGKWSPIRVSAMEVILRLDGTNQENVPVEMVLHVTAKDIQYGELSWFENRERERWMIIDPDDAEAHGLPRVWLSAKLQGLAFLPHLYPDAETYASLSGPPGGPLFFIIKPLREAVPDAAALEAFVVKFAGAQRNFSLGPAGEIKLQNSPRIAQLYYTGVANAAAVNCAVVVSHPAMLLLFGHGGRPEHAFDVATVAADPAIAGVLKTLMWMAK